MSQEGGIDELLPATSRAPEDGTETGVPVVRGVTRRLDAAYVTAARLTGWIVTGVVAVAGSVAFLVLAGASGGGWLLLGGAAAALVALLAVLAAAAHAWPALEYRRTSWRVDDEGIEIRRGVVWRHAVSVPRARIQHTDVAQGPIQRRFGLATLVVHTAGNREYEVRLWGLSRPVALGVRDFLLEGGDERDV